MKPIRILVLIAFLCLGLNQASAQVYRFKTTSMSLTEKDEKGKWEEWAAFKKAELIITLDGKKDRFVVNSKELQLFKIVAYMEKVSNEDTDTLAFDCVDNEGSKCAILIITHKKENNRMQFYINYPDYKMVYNIYNIK